MNQLMTPLTSSHLIFNADATQFTVGYDSAKNRSEVASIEEGRRRHYQIYFIKYYCLISAFGNSADPVYILADDAMKKDEIDTYVVPGLHIGPQLVGRG